MFRCFVGLRHGFLWDTLHESSHLTLMRLVFATLIPLLINRTNICKKNLVLIQLHLDCESRRLSLPKLSVSCFSIL